MKCERTEEESALRASKRVEWRSALHSQQTKQGATAKDLLHSTPMRESESPAS